MKLELKHLAPYLPYDLKAKIGKEKPVSAPMSVTFEMISGSEVENVPCFRSNSRDKFKIYPILRPLSDLTKEIEHDGEGFVPYEHITFVEAMIANEYLEYLCEAKASLAEDRLLPYSIVQLLFEWHFDVFGLLEKGLAININNL